MNNGRAGRGLRSELKEVPQDVAARGQASEADHKNKHADPHHCRVLLVKDPEVEDELVGIEVDESGNHPWDEELCRADGWSRR